MTSPIVVVGLGNPGGAYARTRHNAGFDVLDIVSQRWGWKIKKSARRSLLAEGRIADEDGSRQPVVLALPQTFMNESGEAVAALARWYKPQPAHLLVVYDDIDLPVGAVRVRAGGGTGTHNGMRSIQERWGHADFPRVRVGIGAPPPGWDLKDWVLSKRPDAELEIAFDAMCRAADAVAMFAKTRDIEKVMRIYNARA